MRDFSPQICRAGRSLLGWTAVDLAREAQIGLATVKRFELGGDARQSSVEAMQSAMRGAGLLFIAGGQSSLDGGPGVRVGAGFKADV